MSHNNNKMPANPRLTVQMYMDFYGCGKTKAHAYRNGDVEALGLAAGIDIHLSHFRDLYGEFAYGEMRQIIADAFHAELIDKISGRPFAKGSQTFANVRERS